MADKMYYGAPVMGPWLAGLGITPAHDSRGNVAHGLIIECHNGAHLQITDHDAGFKMTANSIRNASWKSAFLPVAVEEVFTDGGISPLEIACRAAKASPKGHAK